MQIKTIGHSFEIAVEEIIQLFFSKEDDILIESTLKEDLNSYQSIARIVYKGREATSSIKCDKQSITKTKISNLIKKSVFNVAKKFSPMNAPWGISTGIRPAKIALSKLLKCQDEKSVISFLENEYWMSENKARLALSVAKTEYEILKDQDERAISVYIGVPFCPTRCAYCSFISQSTEHNKKYIDMYADYLLTEMHAVAKLIKKLGFFVESIYFGGGTPTTLSNKDLDKILKACYTEFDLANCTEITVEAGRPDTVNREKLLTLKDNGVNRICINPQTMHQETLDKIGRGHSVEDVYRAFEIARSVGFDDINSDIIVGLPGENANMVSKTLDGLIKLSPEAITVHTMYLKRAARLSDDFEKYRFAQNTGEMIDLVNSKLLSNGYEAYYLYKQKNTLGNLENVGYSKPGYECLYNMTIMEETRTVFAIGAGASTKLVKNGKIDRIFNPKEAGDYINRIDEIVDKKNNIYKWFKEE